MIGFGQHGITNERARRQKVEAMITISLPKEMELALAEVTREEGLSQSELIQKALADFLFLRKFRSLRERLLEKNGQRYTDQDIFEIVS
jgi:Arc/MetJ-type ribon-helix-helix transcriptional regulator